MTTAFVNARVMLPGGFAPEPCVVTIEGARIAALGTEPPAGADVVDLHGQMLLPGFIDTQVNGGGGVLFNDDPSVTAIAAIGAAHRRHGTTGFLPTLISDDLDKVAAAIAAVDAAIGAGVPGVLGIHIEGPFLTPERRGIHREDKLRVLRGEDVALLTSLKRGKTLVTLAPEASSPGQIARLAAAGVIVALGHTAADYDTASAAFAAGATGVTHLFNAMTQLGHRAPGVVGAALESDAVFAGLIVDGFHLHPAAVRVAIRAKGANRIMLVTDAMPSAGSEAPTFELQGRTIRREGDRLVGEDGTLAGSALTMDRTVANVIAQTGVSLAEASQMASATPAQFLGLEGLTGEIAPGMRADLVALSPERCVTATWIAGQSESAR